MSHFLRWVFLGCSLRGGVALIGGFLLGGVDAFAAPQLSQLQVEQPITVKDSVYRVAPGLSISFKLASPADVIVQVSRHLAGYKQFKWPYLKEPIPVRTLVLGKMQAGVQSVTWDGLDDKGQPITEVHNMTGAEVVAMTPKPTSADQITQKVPVNYFQVSVKANDEQLTANFQREIDILEPNRLAHPFNMATMDKQGHYIGADFTTWAAYGYTPDFILESGRIWPQDNSFLGADPAECRMVHVNSRGDVLIMNTSGIYRYDSKGFPQPWPHQAAYIPNGPNGDVLGTRVSDAGKTTQPGFGTNFDGFDVDDKDNIYLARSGAQPSVEVFDVTGNYLRDIALPADAAPGGVAYVGGDTIAVGTGKNLLLIDTTSGAVKKTITLPAQVPANFVQADKDRNIYTGPGAGNLWRFTSTGDPLPFNPALPNVKDNNLALDPGSAHLGHGAAGFALAGVNGIAFGADGSIYTSEAAPYPPPPGTKSGLLHYAKDGTFQPSNLTVAWGCHNLSNIFLNDEPAILDLLVNNFTAQKQPFTVHWTLTDFEGKKIEGDSRLVADAMARQVLSFNVTAREMGYYHLDAEVRQGDNFVEKLTAQLARIIPHDLAEDRYSRYSIGWLGEAYVMGVAGGKIARGDYLNWGNLVEPLPGLFYQTHYEVPQWGFSGADSIRTYFRKWGFLTLNMLNYGENWLGGGGGPIYSYDLFYDYCQHMLGIYAPHHEAFYQFWNEPNFFWRYGSPDPFAREQYSLVLQHVWSIVKSHDKDTLSLGDGDAGAITIMQQLADWGAAGFSDTVEMHYPASTPLAYNNMQVPDLPESKAIAISKLVDLRDKSFPGKPVWNTEENIPDATKSAELAAINLPRVEIPEFAVGVDTICQFSQTAVEGTTLHEVTAFLDEFGQPFPTYPAYATMTRMIDDNLFVGQADFGAGNYGYLFVRPHDFVLAANSIGGSPQVTIDAGSSKVTVVDLMGRSRQVSTEDGKLTLTLSTKIQYVVLPRTGGARQIAANELKKELDALKVTAATDIPNQMTDALKTAGTDPAAMNRLYHLVKAAEVASAAGAAPTGGNADEVKAARQAVEKREGDDGYLREARVVLEWAGRLAQIASHDPTMAWPTLLASQAAEALAASESPCYPGAAINAYIGEPGAIEKIRATVPVANKPETAIDNQFRFEIDRKPGDTFELELTVCDYYQHKLEGTVTPRLPAGWQVSPTSATYSVEGEKWQRFMFTVTVPADAKPGTFSVGGQTTYNGAAVQELHPMRIKL